MSARFRKLLIANRGEIACRIARSAHAMGLQTVAVYSDADAGALHTRECDEAVHIGPAAAVQSYLKIDAIIEAARRSGAEAIHPGYGFLAENAALPRACAEAGLVFVGPSAEAIEAMGNKIGAKQLVQSHGVPVVPGYAGNDQSEAKLQAEAEALGTPLLIKAAAGGGGKGMRIVRALEEFPEALRACRGEAERAFGDGDVLLERYVDKPRHVEVQVLGDTQGEVVHLFERECSIQRRHQKIVEESPSPVLSDEQRARMCEAAVAAAKSVHYVGAGTVEFIVDASGDFYFLEMNTRLQVEHPVTELVCGVDLVRAQLEVAMGAPLPWSQDALQQQGHAIELRIYAEDPAQDYLPQGGPLLRLDVPAGEGVRLDTGYESGDVVPIDYDPMIAKLIIYGCDRGEAIARALRALRGSQLLGMRHNLGQLAAILRSAPFEVGDTDTHFLEHHAALVQENDEVRARRQQLAAFAVVAQRAAQRAGAREVLPGLAPGWRNNRFRDAQEQLRVDGEERTLSYRVEGDAIVVKDGDGEHRVELRAGRLSVDGHSCRCSIAEDGEKLWSWTPAGAASIEVVPRFPPPGSRVDAGTLGAPVPGTVVGVDTEPGAEVEAGQVLVRLDAMKMEHSVRAPVAGQVESVLVEVGERVGADQPLVRMVAPGD